MAFWKKLGKYALKVGKYAIPIALGMTGVGIPAAMAASAALNAADTKVSGGSWKQALISGGIGAASGAAGGALGGAAKGIIGGAAARGAANAAARAGGQVAARSASQAIMSGVGHGITALGTAQGLVSDIKGLRAEGRAERETSQGIGPSAGAYYNTSGSVRSGGMRNPQQPGNRGVMGNAAARSSGDDGGSMREPEDGGSFAQPRGGFPREMTPFGPRAASMGAGRGNPFIQQARILARNDSPMAHMMNQGRRDALMSQPYRAELEPLPEIRDPETDEVIQRPDPGRPGIFPQFPQRRRG